MTTLLTQKFFDTDAQVLAKKLLGKVIRVRYKKLFLAAMIVETEAYYLKEKGSHASLGFTEKRKALFMPAGTIYMYYARGGDSLNISAKGEGNAVLIKAGMPYIDSNSPANMLQTMSALNPLNDNRQRPQHRLCSGQTLLCKSLNLKVPIWDQKNFNEHFYVEDVNYQPSKIIQTTRLGIPEGRDEHLHYRFIDLQHVKSATQNPLTKRKQMGYTILTMS